MLMFNIYIYIQVCIGMHNLVTCGARTASFKSSFAMAATHASRAGTAPVRTCILDWLAVHLLSFITLMVASSIAVPVARIPTPRAYLGVAVLDDIVYTVGGMITANTD